MSCTDHSRNYYINNDNDFERNYVLTRMINELYSQFYSKNFTNLKTSKYKIFFVVLLLFLIY